MEENLKNRVSFTVAETARMVGCQPLQIYKNLKTIPHTRIGKKILIKKSYIDELSGETA